MRPTSCKAKGRRLAQEVQKMILETFPDLSPDDVIVTSSGTNGEDLRLSPKARGMLPISIECKNTERLDIWRALEQAEANAGGFLPAVFFRRNRSNTYVVLSADEFLTIMMVRAMWIQQHARGINEGENQ